MALTRPRTQIIPQVGRIWGGFQTSPPVVSPFNQEGETTMTAMTDATNALGDTPPTACPVCTGPCTLPGEGPTGQLGGLCTVCGWDYLVAKGVNTPCPSWCQEDHTTPEAIENARANGEVSHAAYIQSAEAFSVDVTTSSEWREVFVETSSIRGLTPNEARQLAAALVQAADMLDGCDR